MFQTVGKYYEVFHQKDVSAISCLEFFTKLCGHVQIFIKIRQK